jgi:hypothetical protein
MLGFLSSGMLILLGPLMSHLWARNLNTQVMYGGLHIKRIERLHKKFLRYVLQELGWTDIV